MRVAIVGAGRGGSEMLRVLHDDENIRLVGIADIDSDAPGLSLARELGFAAVANIDQMEPFDLAINVTVSSEIADQIRHASDEKVEIIEGASARFFYEQVARRQQQKERADRVVAELEQLNRLSRQLDATDQLNDMLALVLKEAMHVLDMPAGSISLYDRESNSLQIGVSAGFSEAFDRQSAWEVRQGGLTERILASRVPFVVDDATQADAGFRRSELLESEGVISVVAVPMILGTEIVGILYVDDFRPRSFSDDQLRMLSLLANDAAHAIQKVRLIKALRREKQSLKQFNEELESRVMARTQELTRANEELVRVSQAKSQFISNMSHELRTPLTSINGFSELLLDELFGAINEQQRAYLENIHTSGKHLLELINGILDMAKIESGRMSLDLEHADIGRLIDEVMHVLEGYAAKAEVSFEIDLEESLPTVPVDRTRFKQILYNLCSNAIKFSPESGVVTLRIGCAEEPAIGETAEGEANAVRLSVQDQGIGIAPEHIERIFNPFEQVDGSHSRRFEGTGLGLSLTKRLVEMHGGHIEVESETGDGSCFHVILPLEAAHRTEAMTPAWAEQLEGESRLEHTTGAGRRAYKQHGVEADAPLILVVDDDPDTQELFTLYLAEEGYRVCRASNGEEALARARELRPFLILLDVMMPGKDGWEVLQELKLNAETCDIPVMMCSVVEGQELGFALGATDYLSKPIDRRILSDKLASLNLHRKPRSGPVHLLAMDDDPKILDLYAGSLPSEQYRVHTAASGSEGLSMAEAVEPDVILLDLMMPEMDGFAVVEALKQHPKLRETPVIVVTAKELSVAERMQLTGHVEELISKSSFTRDQLMRQIQHFEQVYPQRAGLKDPVSGLLNHRYLQLRLGQEISRASRAQKRFSCVLFDLDHFHRFCDAAGQAYAHTALRKVGEFLMRDSRGADVASRYRVDEFAMILADTELEPAIKVANRFRYSVEIYPFPREGELGETHGLTMSAGVAVYPDDGESPEALMQACQYLVQAAKEHGRNRVAYFQDGEVRLT
ncbi:MAG TPA: response regulator [Mariprofundaceae bacterium]|nr:response regulator [Mariprofundaceae bacterium]